MDVRKIIWVHNILEITFFVRALELKFYLAMIGHRHLLVGKTVLLMTNK